jgi:hypothetical protein
MSDAMTTMSDDESIKDQGDAKICSPFQMHWQLEAVVAFAFAFVRSFDIFIIVLI